MKREAEMLDALFQHATEGIIICDAEGVIRMLNPKAEELFGYKQEELEGKKIEVLLPARYKHGHVKLRSGYTENPGPRTMGHGRDLFGLRKDGSELMLEVSLSPFTTNEGRFVMSFIVDVSERKRHDLELRMAHDQLRQASEALSLLNEELEAKVQERTEELAEAIQRLAISKKEVMRALEKERELNELKSRFVTTASHEFRTPLGTILSSVALIARYEKTEDADKRNKHINRIKSAVSNLTEILNDFLSLEKLEEGIVRHQPAPMNLRALLSETCEEMKMMARGNQEIVFVYEGMEEVSLDRQVVKNVFINLLSNAIKYSPDGKKVALEVKSDPDRVFASVKDDGIGIPKEDQANLFERFYRARNATNIQGTGLGLNIVKKYVELMDGTITFRSEPGEGTVFYIDIPLSKLN